MTTATRKPISRGTWVRAALMGVGAVIGAATMISVDRLSDAGLFDLAQLSWSHALGLSLGGIMGGSGLFAIAVSFNARLTATAMDPDAKSAPRAGQTMFYRQQGAVMLLAGLMMAAPVIAILVFGETPPRGLAIAMLAGLVGASLIQTMLNLSVWNRADEMMRRMIAETGSVCFWLLQGLFYLWAAAEVLGLAPALSSWDLMTVLMAVYLAVSAGAALQRGLA